MTKTPDGYYGVIIPKYNFYQGYFLHEDSLKSGCLEHLRSTIRGSLSEVRSPTPGISSADQGLFGALCAALVEETRIPNSALLSQIGGAISNLTSSKYYIVSGEFQEKGIKTKFWRMPAEIDSPDTARDYIHGLPEVQYIQTALLKEAYELAHGKKKRQ